MVSPNPIASRLEAKGIRRVLVVDDAFDCPVRSDLAHNELADFWNELELDSSELRGAVEGILGSIPASEEDIDDACVAALYHQRDNLGPLQVAFDRHLKIPLREKHGHLDPLIGELENLGLDVVRIGTTVPVDPGPAQLIFQDYYLGPPREDTSVETARVAVNELLALYPVGSDKPLVVLMSSHDDVQTLAEGFRGETGIVGGMFYFLPKSDLVDRVRLLLDLDMLAMALPDGHLIQRFLDTIEDKIGAIVPEFLKDIKRLNLDDYVYIQRLSLQADGHPLGDYLLWLYSAYFGHLLFERALGTERRALDKMRFQDWMPSQVIPSTQLTAMYNAALFDMTVEPLGPHPRRPNVTDVGALAPEEQGASAGQVEELPVCQGIGDNGLGDSKDGDASSGGGVDTVRALPYFNMGDIFLSSDSAELLMVSNPACDLQFTPDGKRLPNLEESILFIPGTLEKLREPLGSPTIRTELFQHGEDSYRILWQPKQLRAVPYGDVEEWLSGRRFARVARLRMPFSLEIQQYFANQLTRVGVPVAPPFYRPLQVALYKRGPDGNYERLTIAGSEKEAFVVTAHTGEKQDEQCVFVDGLVRVLQRTVSEIASQDLVAVEGALEVQECKRRERANRRIQKAIQSARDFFAWREVASPFTLPSRGATIGFESAGIVVGHGVPVNGPWTSDALLMVHVSESQPPHLGLPHPPQA